MEKPEYTGIYVKTNTRTLLKALAHIDNRTLTSYLDILAHTEAAKIRPHTWLKALEAVSDA